MTTIIWTTSARALVLSLSLSLLSVSIFYIFRPLLFQEETMHYNLLENKFQSSMLKQV